MDQKSLAVLQQLKSAMQEQKKKDQPEFDRSAGEAAIKALDSIGKIWSKKSQAEQSKPKVNWLKKTCRFCKSEFVVNPEWKPQPIMCKGCRAERKTRYEVPEGDTLYTQTKVFHGGGPGTGRRK